MHELVNKAPSGAFYIILKDKGFYESRCFELDLYNTFWRYISENN